MRMAEQVIYFKEAGYNERMDDETDAVADIFRRMDEIRQSKRTL